MRPTRPPERRHRSLQPSVETNKLPRNLPFKWCLHLLFRRPAFRRRRQIKTEQTFKRLHKKPIKTSSRRDLGVTFNKLNKYSSPFKIREGKRACEAQLEGGKQTLNTQHVLKVSAAEVRGRRQAWRTPDTPARSD